MSGASAKNFPLLAVGFFARAVLCSQRSGTEKTNHYDLRQFGMDRYSGKSYSLSGVKSEDRYHAPDPRRTDRISVLWKYDRFIGKVGRPWVSAVLKQSFLFSVRNTTLPVEIKNDTIQTTKPNASIHGFGLSNIKLILNKYHADFVMDYEDGWFQFTGEIEA